MIHQKLLFGGSLADAVGYVWHTALRRWLPGWAQPCPAEFRHFGTGIDNGECSDQPPTLDVCSLASSGRAINASRELAWHFLPTCRQIPALEFVCLQSFDFPLHQSTIVSTAFDFCVPHQTTRCSPSCFPRNGGHTVLLQATLTGTGLQTHLPHCSGVC